MKNISINGKSFVAIMIVIAISALLLRLVIERIIDYSIAQNESLALAAVKEVAVGLENFAKENQGKYPASLSTLAKTKPPYLEKDYSLASPIKGYGVNFTKLDSGGYSCYAFPSLCKVTGNTVFSIATGGVITQEPCEKKE